MDLPETLFPYVHWLHAEGFASPYCLSASGVPAPDAALLGPPEAWADLGPAPADALPALEARLAALFGVAPERVVAQAGASGAMHAAALTLFGGAHVVVERPGFEPFGALARIHAASTAVVERRFEDGFALCPEAVAEALARGAGPGHLFLCQPHNPTGALLEPRELAGLARLAEQAGGVLIANEVYMETAPVGERWHAFHCAPNTLSLGSLTKAYGLGALRVGWCVLGEGLVGLRRRLVDRSRLLSLDLATPMLRAGRAALDRLEVLLQPLRAYEARCRPVLERWLAETPSVAGRVGSRTPFAFPRVTLPQGVPDTRALAQRLAAEHGVGVVPGEFFGAPGHLRIGYCVPESTLAEALERLARGIAESAPPGSAPPPSAG